MEFITQLFTWANDLPDWLNALSALVLGATGITLLTPTKKDNEILDAVSKVLNFLAGNVAHNKNADSE